MKKDRFKELSGIFQRMTVENQLRLIEFMAADISLYAEDSQYKNQLKAAYGLLDCIKQKLHNQEKNAEFAEMMTILDTLSASQLMGLLNKTSKLIHKFDADNKQKEAESMCKTEGHVFSNWKENRFTNYISPAEAYGIEGLLNGGTEPTIPVEKVEWRRTCERCGYEEIVREEPEEVKKERLTKAKDARIRKLKKELKDLESS